MFNPEK